MACTLDRRYLAVAQTTDGQGIPQTILCMQILKGELVWSPVRFDAIQLLLPSVSPGMKYSAQWLSILRCFAWAAGTSVTLLFVTISFKLCDSKGTYQ